MYRIIYRGGSYIDVETPPTMPHWEEIWAVVNLDIVDGGDAYQALLRTLEAEAV